MKAISVALVVLMCAAFINVRSQSIVGVWQLVSHTTCLDDALPGEDDDTNELIADMQSRSRGTSSVIRFKDNSSGDESIHLLDKRKTVKRSSFMYKFDGNRLYFLDKKSKLMVGTYDVDRLGNDSLIFSNASRACETRVFIRLNDGK